MARILCIDDDDAVRGALEKTLTRQGHHVQAVPDVLRGLQAVAATPVDLILTDWAMPSLTGMDLLDLLKQQGDATPVIMITAFGSIEHAVEAIRAGAVNYVTKPFSAEQLELAVAQGLELARLRADNTRLLDEAAARRAEHEIIGESRSVRHLLDTIGAAATSRATVLLQGESGTGKELLARAIHEQSDRRAGPFIRINCAAMPEGLIESTLFGHERGAFTGAVKRTLGAFERADGGTLLLDEVSEMRIDLQPKLLRVLQEREFERVGGTHPIRTDVRIVCTTNRDLARCVAEGSFRQDLFYRINVFPVHVPPLRERIEDLPLLAFRFAARAAKDAGKRFEGMSREAVDLLRQHDWPGNVRELQHTMERAVILATAPMLEAHLFSELAGARKVAAGAMAGAGADLRAGTGVLDLGEIERRAIQHALRITGDNRTRAAQLLGIDVRTLRRKLKGEPGTTAGTRADGTGRGSAADTMP